ncbi:MAG: hypothetical protein ACJ739_10420 [Acidimicrobiales bacterium]
MHQPYEEGVTVPPVSEWTSLLVTTVGQTVVVMDVSSLRRPMVIGAMVALLVAGLTGVMLTRVYVPAPGGPGTSMSNEARWSRQVTDIHEVAFAASAILLPVLLGTTMAARRRSRASAVEVGAAIGALVMLGLAVLAWSRVQFEGLGLWAVTIGDDLRGLWFAAFSDQVRFVFLDGREVPQSQISPWVVIHLLAPLLGLLLLIVGLVAARGPRRVVVTVDEAGPDRNPLAR